MKNTRTSSIPVRPENLVAEVNRMAMDGWQAKSIGAIGAVAEFRGVYVLMEREKG